MLPKVAVCPPKNTFTNLNYDLMRIGNLSLDNDTRTELIKYAVELTQDHAFKELMNNISQIEEENRYGNWYNGYTDFQLPYWAPTSIGDNFQLHYDLHTKATSGSISTKYFGKQFDKNLIERELSYKINIISPEDIQDIENFTLHVDIEYNMLKDFDNFFDPKYLYHFYNTTFTRKFTPPSKIGEGFEFHRKISLTDIGRFKIPLMPGFKLTWYYLQTEPEYYDQDEEETQEKIDSLFKPSDYYESDLTWRFYR